MAPPSNRRPLDAAGNALGRTSSRARAVGNAVMTIRWPLEVALAVIGIVILLVTTRPSPAAVGWLTFALVGILVIVEMLARMAGAPTPSTHADGEPNGGSQRTARPAHRATGVKSNWASARRLGYYCLWSALSRRRGCRVGRHQTQFAMRTAPPTPCTADPPARRCRSLVGQRGRADRRS